jgi:hypothetical protein
LRDIGRWNITNEAERSLIGGRFDGERHPVAERMSRRGFHLPCRLALALAQQEQRVAAVLDMMIRFLSCPGQSVQRFRQTMPAVMVQLHITVQPA